MCRIKLLYFPHSYYFILEDISIAKFIQTKKMWNEIQEEGAFAP